MDVQPTGVPGVPAGGDVTTETPIGVIATPPRLVTPRLSSVRPTPALRTGCLSPAVCGPDGSRTAQVSVMHEPLEVPMPVERRRIHHQASHAVSNLTTFLGSFTAIAVAAVLVTIWAIGLLFVRGGPFNTHYAMVITSVTTMVTFVMVFIIQSTQNRESRAMQTKLDALLIAKHGLDEGELLGLEDKPDGAIRDVQTDVHDTERRASEQRNQIVVSPNVGVRPSDHLPQD